MPNELKDDTKEQKKLFLVGTGPISMVKALLLSKKFPNATITLLDSNPEVGGAWYSEYSPKGHEIECGCHIWSYSPKVYNYIQNELGVSLAYMHPTPLFIGKNIKLPYSTKNFLDSYRYIFKSFITGKWKNLRLNNNPAYYWKIGGKRNKYPKLGSPELIHALETKIREARNIIIQNDIRVLEISANNDVIINTNKGELKGDYVTLTSVSEIGKVRALHEEINIEQKRIDYIHLTLQLSRPLLKKISYWRIMDDPVVHRYTDISYQTKNEENIVLVGIKGDAFDKMSEQELVDYNKTLMLKYGLIDQNYKLENIKTHIFPTFYLAGEVRDKINQIDPRVELLHSTDLIYGMQYLLQEEGLV